MLIDVQDTFRLNLVILDNLESNAKGLRNKTLNWFNSVIMLLLR